MSDEFEMFHFQGTKLEIFAKNLKVFFQTSIACHLMGELGSLELRMFAFVQCYIEKHWQDHRGRTSAHPIYLYRLYTAIRFSCLGAVLRPGRFQKLPQ